MLSKKIIVFITGIVIGASVAFALSYSFTVILNLKPTDPVDWGNVTRSLNMYIAPGQTLNINKVLGQAHQRSDKVKYCISIDGDLGDYNISVTLFSLLAKNNGGTAYITPTKNKCVVIEKTTTSMNEIPVDITLHGWIKSRTNMSNIEQVKITITAEPQP